MNDQNRTEQEAFWAGDFGDAYTDRNEGMDILALKIKLFSEIMSHTKDVNSVLEIGSNKGLNLKALKLLRPDLKMEAIEINSKAAEACRKIPDVNVFNGSAFEYDYSGKKFDMSYTCGVLIHIAPEKLDDVYKILYETSKRYIMVYEYYNPVPVDVNYRGNEDKLFKRDFAGEIMDKYPDLQLVDYGFTYHRDNNFIFDDANWFLMEKR